MPRPSGSYACFYRKSIFLTHNVDRLFSTTSISYAKSQKNSYESLGYRPTIGLEIHTQLNSENKLFSGSINKFDASPNQNVALFDAGYPGTLPVLNPECVKKAISTVLALEGQVQSKSSFDRKHYFYPDLPNGYQITQRHFPIGLGGKLTLFPTSTTEPSTVYIEQIQLEQDTATLSELNGDQSINLNRAGCPLIEIVTLPCIHSSEVAGRFVAKLQGLLRAIKVSDGMMEEGSIRCDVNVSIAKDGEELGVRCELKNLNSIKTISAAIDAEIIRQIQLLEQGQSVEPETRGYDVTTKQTFKLRSKATNLDYRYMPEPDLPTLFLSSATISKTQQNLPELPDQTYQRWTNQLGIKPADAITLLTEPGATEFFNATLKATTAQPQTVSNWITTTLFGILAKHGHRLTETTLTSKQLSSILNQIDLEIISAKVGKSILISMVEGDSRLAPELIEINSLAMISDKAILEPILIKLIAENPKRADKALTDQRTETWFLGKVMGLTNSNANPKVTKRILMELIGNRG